MFHQAHNNTSPSTRWTLALSLLAVLGCLVGSTALAASNGSHWREGRLLVEPAPGLSDTELDEVLRGHGVRSLGRLRNLKVHEVEVPMQAEAAIANALSHNPHIAFAEPDMLVAPDEILPNDPKYASAWHLPKIGLPWAWELSQADGVVIAILDTGVDANHPDLASKMLVGWNAVDGSNDTSDINGHGTAVAGTASASTDNAIGVASVAWNAFVLPVRVTNSSDGYAYYSDIARALTWAADQGAQVANISFGVSGSSTVTSAANYMRAGGGVVVVAAGNDGLDPGLADNPAMITVSATTSTDAKASWSNFGSFIDVAAPGAAILTTNRGGSYGSWNGTSFASPVTAGVVALIMGANPLLTPDQVEQVLEQSADDVTGVDWDPDFGDGRVNAAAAVEMALTTVAVDEIHPVVSLVSPSNGETLSGLVLVEADASDNLGVSEVVLLVDGVEIATDVEAPYAFSWDSNTVADGVHTITLHAYDAASNLGSATGQITVGNGVPEPDETAPTVVFETPTDGATVAKRVSISLAATDDQGVVSMNLYIDGSLVSATSSATIVYNWNLRKVADGQHSLSAVAADAAGNEGQASISVQIGATADAGTDDTTSSKPGKGNSK